MPNNFQTNWVYTTAGFDLTYTTAAIPDFDLIYTTRGAAFELSYTTGGGTFQLGYTTGGGSFDLTFTTETKSNNTNRYNYSNEEFFLRFEIKTPSFDLTFTTVEGVNDELETVYVNKLDEDAKNIRFTYRLSAAPSGAVTYRITNLRNGATKTGTLLTGNIVYYVEILRNQDGVYHVELFEDSVVSAENRVLVFFDGCLEDIDRDLYSKLAKEECADCKEKRRKYEALTRVIDAAYDTGEYVTVHNMMEILDDVCEDCLC